MHSPVFLLGSLVDWPGWQILRNRGEVFLFPPFSLLSSRLVCFLVGFFCPALVCFGACFFDWSGFKPAEERRAHTGRENLIALQSLISTQLGGGVTSLLVGGKKGLAVVTLQQPGCLRKVVGFVPRLCRRLFCFVFSSSRPFRGHTREKKEQEMLFFGAAFYFWRGRRKLGVCGGGRLGRFSVGSNTLVSLGNGGLVCVGAAGKTGEQLGSRSCVNCSEPAAV